MAEKRKRAVAQDLPATPLGHQYVAVNKLDIGGEIIEPGGRLPDSVPSEVLEQFLEWGEIKDPLTPEANPWAGKDRDIIVSDRGQAIDGSA